MCAAMKVRGMNGAGGKRRTMSRSRERRRSRSRGADRCGSRGESRGGSRGGSRGRSRGGSRAGAGAGAGRPGGRRWSFCLYPKGCWRPPDEGRVGPLIGCDPGSKTRCCAAVVARVHSFTRAMEEKWCWSGVLVLMRLPDSADVLPQSTCFLKASCTY